MENKNNCTEKERFYSGTCLFYSVQQWVTVEMSLDARSLPSSETQGQLVGVGKRLNGRGKKSGEEKSRTKVGAPGILLLTDQFRNLIKLILAQKYFLCPIRVQFFPCYFRDVLFEDVHRQTFCSPVRRLFTCSAREFPSIEKCHRKKNHETAKTLQI